MRDHLTGRSRRNSHTAFAIDGITRENLLEVLATGFTRVAVSGAIATADEPEATARQLVSALT